MEVFKHRKIIHVDMDAFYASVEQMDDPRLSGKPLAVGGSGDRGVIAAASYEARKFGVRSAMSGRIAKELCPDLIFVTPRFERYKEISTQVREIFHRYTDLVEPLSLDEAYLDVTENKTGHLSATLLAEELRGKIKEEVGLNASAGISINKFVAKIASDINKPNGQKTVGPDEVLDFISQLAIRKFYGVGEKTTQKMYRLGIFKGEDLRNKSLEFLQNNFKKHGQYYYDLARGLYHGEVKPHRLRKSIATERTFSKNISSEIYLEKELEKISESLAKRLEMSKVKGRTLTLKLKYSDFSTVTRSKTSPEHLNKRKDLFKLAKELLYQEKLKESVRLIGLSMTNLDNKKEDSKAVVQLTLEF